LIKEREKSVYGPRKAPVERVRKIETTETDEPGNLKEEKLVRRKVVKKAKG